MNMDFQRALSLMDQGMSVSVDAVLTPKGWSKDGIKTAVVSIAATTTAASLLGSISLVAGAALGGIFGAIQVPITAGLYYLLIKGGNIKSGCGKVAAFFVSYAISFFASFAISWAITNAVGLTVLGFGAALPILGVTLGFTLLFALGIRCCCGPSKEEEAADKAQKALIEGRPVETEESDVNERIRESRLKAAEQLAKMRLDEDRMRLAELARNGTGAASIPPLNLDTTDLENEYGPLTTVTNVERVEEEVVPLQGSGEKVEEVEEVEGSEEEDEGSEVNEGEGGGDNSQIDLLSDSQRQLLQRAASTLD
jgi:hypothetical protein